MDVPIGKITHYYDKIGVAVIDVSGQVLKIGDTLRITGHDKEFQQRVNSLQIEHKQVNEVKPGDSAGLKVDQPVKEGDAVFLSSNS